MKNRRPGVAAINGKRGLQPIIKRPGAAQGVFHQTGNIGGVDVGRHMQILEVIHLDTVANPITGKQRRAGCHGNRSCGRAWRQSGVYRIAETIKRLVNFRAGRAVILEGKGGVAEGGRVHAQHQLRGHIFMAQDQRVARLRPAYVLRLSQGPGLAGQRGKQRPGAAIEGIHPGVAKGQQVKL